jgi:hypothetical protein
MTNKEKLQAHNAELQELIGVAEALPDAKGEIKLQTKNVLPTKEIQIVTAGEGYDGLSKVFVGAISDEYIIPSGSVTFTENGEYDVKELETAVVNVAGSGGGGFDADTYFSTGLEQVSLPSATKIREYAFYYNKVIKNISMPQVKTIGQSAFQECNNLVLTELPSGLTSIGQNAFYECRNLAITELPSGITSIGIGAFQYCTSLALTELPSDWTSIINYLFYGCTNLAITELPSGITSIGNGAFSGCTNLAITELPSGLTSIGQNAFNECSKLAITSFPRSLTKINAGYEFQYCTGLTTLEFHDGFVEVGSNAFARCTGLTTVTFRGTPSVIRAIAFANCKNLKTINVPWAQGAVANAPWGATNATINYNYTGG